MRPATAILLAVMCGVVPAGAQQIPIRRLGPAEAVATSKVDALSLVRPLSDGRVIVTFKRSAGILSADLQTYTSIADSTTLGRGQYGNSMIGLFPARGDTTYVVDEGAGGLIIVDPAGKPGRMIALPKASDMNMISYSQFGTARTFVDPKGRLVYRSAARVPGATEATSPPDAAALRAAAPADSFPLVRADFESRVVDTLGMLRIPNPRRGVTERTNDQTTLRTIVYVGPVIDAWTMLQDGTIAIVRGSDYHIDWIHPDGSRSSTPKMAFDWRRITDEEKTRIVDSLRKNADAQNARQDSTRRAAARASNIVTVQDVGAASTIPDYFPPLRGEGMVRADPDGNIWILPTTSASAQGGGPLYDVVNRKGEVVERVQFPPGCSLAGFAKGRAVYLTCPATSLERRRILN